MQMSSGRSGGVSPAVLTITLVFLLLGQVASPLLASGEPFLVLGLMLLIGLPHGATDHGLFLALDRTGRPATAGTFYLGYAGVIGAYALLWWVFPVVAFGLFLLLSVYHFGQSNWADVAADHVALRVGQYLAWGSCVLLTPVLLYFQDSAIIVEAMTGTAFAAPARSTVLAIIGVLALLNVLLPLLRVATGSLSGRRALREIGGLALLLAMFFTNSLLLGFTVYFVFWHSLTSAQDQVRFFRQRMSALVRKQLLLGVTTTVGGALAFCLLVWFGAGPAAALQPATIGGVFVFISLLTLPHMLLVDKLYQDWSPRKATEPKAAARPDGAAQEQSFTIPRSGSGDASGLPLIH